MVEFFLQRESSEVQIFSHFIEGWGGREAPVGSTHTHDDLPKQLSND